MTGRELYRKLPCLLSDDGRCCELTALGCRPRTCFAHYPRHRGMGAGHAGWGLLEGVPLGFYGHELLDRRAGTRAAQDDVIARVRARAPVFWRRMIVWGREHGYYLGPDHRVGAVEDS